MTNDPDIQQKIAHLENQRALLGDAAVDAAIAALRGQATSIKQEVSGDSAVGIAGGAHDSPITTGDDNIISQTSVTGDNPGQAVGVNTGTIIQLIYGPHPTEDKTLLIGYLNVLTETCDALPLMTGDTSDERPLTLQDVYITLDATCTPPYSPDKPDQIEGTREPERRPALSVFCDDKHPQPPRLLLLGGPGMGKSTLVNYLTLCLAEANLENTKASDWLGRLPAWTYGALLPVRVVLREFAACNAVKEASKGSVDLLHTFLSDNKANSNPIPAETVKLLEKHLLASAPDPYPQAVLLFDGLDEVVGDEVLPRTVEMIAAAASTYRTAPILVTCRVLDYNDSDTRQRLVNTHRFRRSELLPLKDEQIQRFIEAWYRKYRVRGRTIKGTEADLLAALARRPELREMADSPLMLTMMAIVHASGRLPETRAELYHRCIEQLLIEWRREPGQPDVLDQLDIPNFERDALLKLMAELGYKTHTNADRAEASRNRPADLGRGQAQAIIAETLVAYIKGDNRDDRCDKKTTEIINKIARRNGLLLKHSEQVYRFAHRSFQEFLAGYALINRPNAVQQWLKHTADVHWHEAIQLMIGFMASSGMETEKPLNLIASLNGRSAVERALAGELLHLVGQGRVEGYCSQCEAGDPLQTIWENTLDSLIGVVECHNPDYAPAPLRIRAARALGDLGDPRPGVCTLPPAMVRIEGGEFVIGIVAEEVEEYVAVFKRDYPDVDEGGLRPLLQENWVNIQPFTVREFEIARHPITNAQYEIFIKNGGYDIDAPWWDEAGRVWLQRDDNATEGLSEWQKRKYKHQPEFWNSERFGIARPNHPVVGISWYEAVAFCRWLTQHLHDGYVYRLPTEAEWEYAARRATRRTYPWGNEEPDGERANYDVTYNGMTAVGCFPLGATPDGIHDLAGNVWEWTGSIYEPYPYDATDGREDISTQPNKRFVNRGGGWYVQSFDLRASYRDHVSPEDFRTNDFGFRPARHLHPTSGE